MGFQEVRTVSEDVQRVEVVLMATSFAGEWEVGTRRTEQIRILQQIRCIASQVAAEHPAAELRGIR